MGAFRKLSLACLIVTFVLVAIGGLVRATSSGLGCGDDWPDCNGRLAPALETRAEVIEFSHRATAGVVVILIASLAVLALRRHRSERHLKWPAVGALALVMSQALIGAVVVWLDLRDEAVVLHLGTAMALVALLVYLVSVSSGHEKTFSDRGLSRYAMGAAGAVFFLLLVGSYVSGRDAGLVFPDWPLMNGKLVPNLAGELPALHFFHRALAAIVGGIVLLTGLRLIKAKDRAPLAARLAHVAMGLYAVEVMIGALNVWTDLNSIVVTSHLAVGALIWASLVGAAIDLHPAFERVKVRPARTSVTPAMEGSR